MVKRIQKKNLENEKEIEKPIINKFIIKKEIILFKNGINTKINVKEITDEINYTKISKTEISNENEKNNKWLVGVKISKNNEKKIVNYSEQNENKQKIDKEDRKMKKIESIMEKIDELDDEDMFIFLNYLEDIIPYAIEELEDGTININMPKIKLTDLNKITKLQNDLI